MGTPANTIPLVSILTDSTLLSMALVAIEAVMVPRGPNDDGDFFQLGPLPTSADSALVAFKVGTGCFHYPCKIGMWNSKVCGTSEIVIYVGKKPNPLLQYNAFVEYTEKESASSVYIRVIRQASLFKPKKNLQSRLDSYKKSGDINDLGFWVSKLPYAPVAVPEPMVKPSASPLPIATPPRGVAKVEVPAPEVPKPVPEEPAPQTTAAKKKKKKKTKSEKAVVYADGDKDALGGATKWITNDPAGNIVVTFKDAPTESEDDKVKFGKAKTLFGLKSLALHAKEKKGDVPLDEFESIKRSEYTEGNLLYFLSNMKWSELRGYKIDFGFDHLSYGVRTVLNSLLL